jgi:hypothetical protein
MKLCDIILTKCPLLSNFHSIIPHSHSTESRHLPQTVECRNEGRDCLLNFTIASHQKGERNIEILFYYMYALLEYFLWYNQPTEQSSL